jgi:hypothetical protein
MLGDGRFWEKGASRWLAGSEGEAAPGLRCAGTRSVTRRGAGGSEVLAGGGRLQLPFRPLREFPKFRTGVGDWCGSARPAGGKANPSSAPLRSALESSRPLGKRPAGGPAEESRR